MWKEDELRRLNKRVKLDLNKLKGKIGEDLVAINYMARGYEVERTGKGSDFRVRKRDLFTGRVTGSKLVEVKTGGSGLSKLQRKMKKKKKGKYEVEILPF